MMIISKPMAFKIVVASPRQERNANGNLQQMFNSRKLNAVNLLRNSLFIRSSEKKIDQIQAPKNVNIMKLLLLMIHHQKMMNIICDKNMTVFFYEFLQRGKVSEMHENDNFRVKCRWDFSERVSNLI